MIFFKNKKIVILLVVFFLLITGFTFGLFRTVRIGSMEANHPWITFDPTKEQGMPYPMGDSHDPNIVYFVFVQKDGEAVKVNLKTKEISPYHFKVEKWEDVNKFTAKFNLGSHFENPKAPTWIEFRGKKKVGNGIHLFGDPVPNRPGIYEKTLRTGYYYIMDNRNNVSVELLRVKIANAEIDFGGLGTAYISPDEKWLIYVLDGYMARTFVFNRQEQSIPPFQIDFEDKVIETWN